MDVLKHQTLRELSSGEIGPLGASLKADGVNFAVFSQYAQEVFLLLFDAPDSPATDTIRLNRTDNTWHIFVKGLKAGQLYGYKADGEYKPAEGKRFNPYKLLIDPYAKAVSGKFKDQDNLLFSYDVNAESKDMAMDERDDASIAPKSIVIDDAFDWQGDKAPDISMDQWIVYEAHLKGFTAHPSSGVKYPGTYLGFIEKIPYLRKLGINAVELMPVHEFFVRNELIEKKLSDYWGYNTISFFAPESSYSTQTQLGCQVTEFKTLVRELHKSGIEVILDVVYNHTGEGNHLGPTLCFKGIDNSTYYALSQNPDNAQEAYRFYLNDTGCGNTLNVENQIAMNLVLDSLKYWTQTMHVDGFRFDLASILARVQGQFSHSSLFFEAVSKDPVLSKVKMIAEPWDLSTYQVGNFPVGWSEWNGKFRDTARKFIKGDEALAGEMAMRLTGSADLYQNDGRRPYNSINFITAHDGFTLRDLYSYNDKHNEANLEDNRDGSNDNHSWKCGVEGETQDQEVLRLRKQMIKNALCCLLCSSGTPMILYGDELMRTQNGNNNAYCQDNELNWLNWDNLKHHHDILDFCTKAIAFRKGCPLLRRRRFFHGEQKNGNNTPDISWFDKSMDTPQWDNPLLKTICYQLAGHEAPFVVGEYHIFFIFNMNYRAAVVKLPQFDGLKWHRIVDTSQKPGEDFRSYDKRRVLRRQDKYYCGARTVNILWAGKMRKIGARYLSDNKCEFIVWAPLLERLGVSIVTGQSSREIDLQRDESGYFSAIVDDVIPGTRYFYNIAGRLTPDPASYSQPEDVFGPSCVIDHEAFNWQDKNWKGIALKSMIIYELHIGTFTPEGTFESAEKRLDDLVDLGITAVEIMPVAQFPGARNWGYDGVYPFAVQHSYGGPEAFKKFIDACHRRGLAVILDVVYNHLGPEGNVIPQFMPVFTDKYHTPWGQAINYDEAHSDGVRNYFIQKCVVLDGALSYRCLEAGCHPWHL